MHLESIRLSNFKNYSETKLDFSNQINCFLGPNGSGKTNLLDAIFYLSFTKSAEQSQDALIIKNEQPFFSIQGSFQKEEKSKKVLCALQKGKKKQIKLDDQPYKKASEHIGKFPAVLIAPNDTDVIRGASEERRKFFDAIISQVDSNYLNNLIAYNHVLKQRNSLLKRFAEKDIFEKDQLEPFTVKLIELGKQIYAVRKEFVTFFIPFLHNHYQVLSDELEQVNMIYQSNFHEDIEKVFEAALQKDRVLKRTNVGVHKDDFDFLMNDLPVKKFGSQGQQKSYLIALKLSNFDFLKERTGMKPILLLDDIFDKLDDHRIAKLIEMVASDAFGQIFITDARPERSMSFVNDLEQQHRFFKVENGQVKLWEV